jgi:hypothetical protein
VFHLWKKEESDPASSKIAKEIALAQFLKEKEGFYVSVTDVKLHLITNIV